LLTERSGQHLEAGRAYAEALGEPWRLPPADRRRAAVRALRERAVALARDVYQTSPTRRREGFWTITLPDTWKHRQTPHCDVYARNDLVAERVAEAVEFHLTGLSEWLGHTLPDRWETRCEIRVHADREALHEATGTEGITFAVSHTRLQGDRVVLRKLEVFQDDPWLLSSTLPHELTHIVIADATGTSAPPLVIDEGLALQAEPPARKLMYRRLLPASAPGLEDLLSTSRLPSDVESFYANAGTLVDWLLLCAVDSGESERPRSHARALLDTFTRTGSTADVWRALDLADDDARRSEWQEWHAARRQPHRMPLMILAQPAATPRGNP
jgi:hypothetical protein